MAQQTFPKSPSYEAKVGEDGTFVSDTKTFPTFDGMDLPVHLLRGITAFGFQEPTAIQQRVIGPFVRGVDVVAQAPSGAGKTAAFVIATLQRLDFGRRQCQALILSPTRELALQTQEMCSGIGQYMHDGRTFCHTFIGGTPIRDEKEKIKQGVLVAVGTAGSCRRCDATRLAPHSSPSRPCH